MNNKKGDIEIGFRAFEEAIRLFREPHIAIKRLRCGHNTLYGWRSGCVPGGLHLARLCWFGADVIYILTGKRTEGAT